MRAATVWQAYQKKVNEIKNSVENFFPDRDPNPRNSRWCIYSLSDDESFIIDKSKSHSIALLCVGIFKSLTDN